MSPRDRVIDEHGLVHFADGTTMFMAGNVRIKLLCGGLALTSFEKTSKRVAPTCFGCITENAVLLAWHEWHERSNFRRRNRR